MEKDATKQLIVAIREHRHLGFIPTVYHISKDRNQEYYTIKEPVTPAVVKSAPHLFSDDIKLLVKNIDEFSDTNLTKVFSKKKINVQDFFKELTQENFEKLIRPFVERRIVKSIDICLRNDIPVFHKPDAYTNIYDKEQIRLHHTPAEVLFHFSRYPDATRYHITILHKDRSISLTGKQGIILANEPCILVLDNDLYTFKDIDGKKLLPFFKNKAVLIPKSAEERYYDTFVKNAIKKYRVRNKNFDIKYERPPQHLQLLLENGMNGKPGFIVNFVYGNEIFTLNDTNQIVVNFENQNDHFVFTRLSRRNKWEEDMMGQLFDLGLALNAMGYLQLASSDSINTSQVFYDTINWINTHSERLSEMGIEIKQNLSENYYTGNLDIKFDVKQEIDWFDIKAIAHFGHFAIPLSDLKEHILAGKREFRLPDGTIAIIPEEWFSKYTELITHGKFIMGWLKLDKHHFMLLPAEDDETQNYKEGVMALLREENKEVQVPENVNATLRNYQYSGLNWLHRHYETNLGACMADDMGLGKTLQTLALLAIVNQNNQEMAPHASLTPVNTALIVTPTSLIINWHKEIKKFVPHLKVVIYTGYDRTKIQSSFAQAHIVLTTYGVVRNDINQLEKFLFNFIILDESQYIKNPDSKLYKSVISLNSLHRLVLTGTPIENSLLDLWAQMNFLNPGLLGSYTNFRENYIVPIEKKADEKQRSRLRNLISPFILRRTKEEVATDLPPLSEQVVYCSMTEEQEKIYEEEKSKVRNYVFEQIDQYGFKRSSIFIFKALTILRQLANHPRLLDKTSEIESGKFEEVVRTIESIIAENHKVLIFSTFVKHIEIYEQYCLEQNHKYVTITGQMTRQQRQTSIDTFQKESDVRIFFISLKAGGVGLNLTDADYVLLLDPWWNPAAEQQALSRAHRIGQTKSVFVYRFISSNTVEEKIQALQARKKQLANALINTETLTNQLSEEDISMLFA